MVELRKHPGRMSEQDRAEAFLKQNTSRFFCSACLGRELGLTAYHGRNLVRSMQGRPGFEMKSGRCSDCSRSRRTIRHVRQAAPD